MISDGDRETAGGRHAVPAALPLVDDKQQTDGTL
jgi:hypothetical protein